MFVKYSFDAAHGLACPEFIEGSLPKGINNPQVAGPNFC